MVLGSLLLIGLAVPVLPVTSYLGVLGLFAWPARSSHAERVESVLLPYFTFVVPAHNEAAGIERTISSLRGVEYPTNRYSILVVADNCADDTASLAERAGARVLVRNDTISRGKGFALKFAFDLLIAEGVTDGVVVVDADSDVSPNILFAFASSIAKGVQALQAHYGIRNATESWRTRLMHIAFILYHGVRSSARERLQLSTGLRGNGMCFTLDTLRQVPYCAFSLVEDVEYGVELGLHGVRVAYVGSATVLGEMVSGSAASESQRKRWEQGRGALVRRYAPQLLRRAIIGRDALLLDLAFDLLTPPLTRVLLFTVGGGAVALTAVVAGVAQPYALIPWAISAAGLASYLARGVQLSSQGPRVLLDLVHAPKYMLWKIGLAIGRRASSTNEWVRTRRKGEGA